MSQTAGSEYEEVIITNYDPRKACWQLSLESLLNCGSEARYELIHEPESPIKTTN
jgi:DNA adenine methylase